MLGTTSKFLISSETYCTNRSQAQIYQKQ